MRHRPRRTVSLAPDVSAEFDRRRAAGEEVSSVIDALVRQDRARAAAEAVALERARALLNTAPGSSEEVTARAALDVAVRDLEACR